MTYFSGLPLAGADKFSQQLNRLLTIPAINVPRETPNDYRTLRQPTTFHVKHGEAFKRQETQPKPKTTKTHPTHPSK